MHRFVHPQTFDVGKRNAGETLPNQDRKSTRLNSSHLGISYAVFCLKKKKNSNARKTIHDRHSTPSYTSSRGTSTRLATACSPAPSEIQVLAVPHSNTSQPSQTVTTH